MTEEDKLWAMKDTDLVHLAEQLDVKVKSSRGHLKEPKENAIAKILKAKEANQ